MKKNTYIIALCAFILSTFNLVKAEAQRVTKTSSKVEQLVNSDTERLQDIFKDIHANPELGFMEFRTADIVAKELQKLGYKTITGIAGTGVVGILENGKGPIVMYRADMDANSIKEITGLPYASTKIVKKDDGTETPVMHGCGHDAHTTWLLGAAKVMVEMKNSWKGTLVFVAQPAEELILGAEAMAKEMYTKGVPQPDYLFGMHTAPLPLGYIAAAEGMRTAGTDQIDVTFKGIGGHGSRPHLAKDPIIMATTAVVEYQSIISRVIDPQKAAVLTVGSIQAGSDNNVIPESALVKINLRWFDVKDREIMIEGIKRVNDGIAYAYDLPKELYPEIVMKGWAYPLNNNPELTAIVVKGLESIAPADKILKEDVVPTVLGSEDFHHLVIHNEKKDYCYINVGIANPEKFEAAKKEGKQFPFAPHTGSYQVDLDAIPYGTKIAAVGLLQIFNAK